MHVGNTFPHGEITVCGGICEITLRWLANVPAVPCIYNSNKYHKLRAMVGILGMVRLGLRLVCWRVRGCLVGCSVARVFHVGDVATVPMRISLITDGLKKGMMAFN